MDLEIFLGFTGSGQSDIWGTKQCRQFDLQDHDAYTVPASVSEVPGHAHRWPLQGQSIFRSSDLTINCVGSYCCMAHNTQHYIHWSSPIYIHVHSTVIFYMLYQHHIYLIHTLFLDRCSAQFISVKVSHTKTCPGPVIDQIHALILFVVLKCPHVFGFRFIF